MQSHSREVGLTQLWWIQGAISAPLSAVGVDKITTKGGFNGRTFNFFFFIQTLSFVFVCLFFKLSRIIMATIYYHFIYVQENTLSLKKLKPPSLSITGHV
jgi:hypothetical protein